MKRRDLLKIIQRTVGEADQTVEISEGGNHTKIGIGSRKTAVPRHSEIDDRLAKKIMQQVEQMIELNRKDTR